MFPKQKWFLQELVPMKENKNINTGNYFKYNTFYCTSLRSKMDEEIVCLI